MQCLFLVLPLRLFCMYPVFCVFWILRNVNFCVFRSFKVLVDISWKCVVKISIQHYCGTLLFEYCSNKVQSVLCCVGLCKTTDCSVYFWFSPFRCFVCTRCFVLFWILRNVNFCVFRSFTKVLLSRLFKILSGNYAHTLHATCQHQNVHNVTLY